MSIDHRIFVVEEDAVFPISQKTFTALYSGKVGALAKFAGQTVQIAVVVYTVQQRKPETIIQIDCERIRIMDDGSIDENYAHEGLHLAANRMWLSEGNQKSYSNVVDAKARFEERQWGADSIECKLYITVGTILINLIPKLLPSSFGLNQCT